MSNTVGLLQFAGCHNSAMRNSERSRIKTLSVQRTDINCAEQGMRFCKQGSVLLCTRPPLAGSHNAAMRNLERSRIKTLSVQRTDINCAEQGMRFCKQGSVLLCTRPPLAGSHNAAMRNLERSRISRCLREHQYNPPAYIRDPHLRHPLRRLRPEPVPARLPPYRASRKSHRTSRSAPPDGIL